MKIKNQKSRIRAIKRTDLIPDLASHIAQQCASYVEASRRIGLFPSQDIYRGKRLFAVYHNTVFLCAFPSLSIAKDYARGCRNYLKNCSIDIVLFEAK